MKSYKVHALVFMLFWAASAWTQDNTGRWSIGTVGSAIKMVEGGRDYSTVEQWVGLSIRRGLTERWSLGLETAVGWVRARRLGVNQFNSLDTYPFKTNLIPAMLHVNYALRMEGRVKPHLDFGAGVIYWETRDLRTAGISTFSNGTRIRGKISPAVSAGFGIDFMLSQRFALTTSGRYNRMLKGNEDTSGLFGFNNLPGDPNKAVAEVQVGFRFFFGGNQDKDGDGLLNRIESLYGTNPKLADSDLDGIDDFKEISFYKTNPLEPDTDSDQIPDQEEIDLYKTDPSSMDTDGDGLDDGKEIKFYETNPLAADSDKDGLKDSEEINVYKTLPLTADSDHDGLKDGVEVKLHNSDPLSADTDSDGLPDGAEVTEHGTNPSKADTDAGSVSDPVEIANGTNPLDPNDDIAQEAIETGPQILEGIEFATGSAEILRASEGVLRSVLETLIEYPERHVVIHGYTDNTGSRSYNMWLSQLRAEAVRSYFVIRGIAPERISAVGFGPDNPIAPNDSPAGRQKNRRIEFVLVQ